LFTQGHHAAGAVALGAAALSDAEGKVARLTGTDDPKGGAEKDVLADGLAAVAIGVGAVAGGVMPALAMLMTYAPKAVNAVPAFLAKHEKLKHYTDKIDKAVEIGRWAVTGAFVANYTDFLHLNWETAAWAGAAAVLAVGAVSSVRQILRYRRSKKNRAEQDLAV
jgi:phosphatidylglycerophosphate synthase